MKDEIKIERVSNGAILTYTDYDGEGKACRERIVFKYDTDAEVGNWEGLIDLLWQVAELLGILGSKYDKQRLEIRIVHGSSYVCKDKKNCEICKEEMVNEK